MSVENLAAMEGFMARAIQLAEKGRYTTHPNPRVGCVISKNNQIIAEGFHHRAGQPHAEINALNNCLESPQNATAYVTLEPCSHTGKTPPCANALITAGIRRVVIAMQDPNPLVAGQGIQKLRDAGIEVEVGILENLARQLNPGFIKRMEQGLPWVRLKLGMSLDGRTAMASGESQWITGSAAREDVQRLRASVDAILSGSGTIFYDDPSLNLRINAQALGIDDGKPLSQPLRVVLDSSLRISPQAKLLNLPGQTCIYTCNDDTNKKELLAAKGATVIVQGCATDNKLPLKAVLRDLAKQQINEVHVEAGATLSGALLQQGLLDEIILYMAPVIMGSDARGLFNLPGLSQMKHKIDLSIDDIRAVGNDWRITLTPVK